FFSFCCQPRGLARCVCACGRTCACVPRTPLGRVSSQVICQLICCVTVTALLASVACASDHGQRSNHDTETENSHRAAQHRTAKLAQFCAAAGVLAEN